MVTLNPNINPAEVSILVVDDIPLNVLLIEKMLKKFEFQILKANNGQQALDIINQKHPHLVLLDIMMPSMNGYEVLETIRKEKTATELPIVMLSALSANDDVTKALRLGANDYLTKPIVKERFFNCICTLLNTAFGY